MTIVDDNVERGRVRRSISFLERDDVWDMAA